MPVSYYVLLGRDIFTTKHAVRVYGTGDVPTPPPPATGPTTTTRPPDSTTDPDSPANRMEVSLALTGVAGDTGQFKAFIEEQGTMKTWFMKVGDSIAHGKIKDIALDHIDYERGSSVQRVLVGQNLLGLVAASTVPVGPSPSVGVGAAPPGAAAPAPGTPAVSSGGNTNDILEKLRARRAAEAGGR